MEAKLNELKKRLIEIDDIEHANALLYWDQSTYMPPGGARARARQSSTLSRLAHEKFIDPAIGKLLDALRPYEEGLPDDSDDARLIRVTRHDYEKAVKVPSDFTAELSSHAALCYDAWQKARPKNDFGSVRPLLQKTVDLSRQLADYFPGYAHIADPLIDFADEGMTVAILRPLFAELRENLVPLVEAITSQAPTDDSCLRRQFPEAKQIAFARDVIARYGFDFERGRLDKTPHPFMTKFSLGDVRITTRVRDDFLGEGLFSILHETGHALYEQGIPAKFEATPLASGTTSGVHESQSRLWENLVGRSRGFWEFFYPRLQAVFPDQLRSVPLEAFYRAINKVERSLIRTDADEVTYNLHVIIRFEIELELLEGKLSLADLPEVWRERYREYLGIASEDDRNGVLQDMHWYAGIVGGCFQCYTIGNILSAQFYDAAVAARPDIPTAIRNGEFELLRDWLRENIHQHGRKFDGREIVKRATGGPLSLEPYLNYLRTKYGEIYTL